MMMMMNNNHYEEEETIDWLDLPFDLLGQITDKVISSFPLSDYVRFGCVCDQWRSFLIENNYKQIKLPLASINLPLLLIPSLDDHHHHHHHNTRRSFYSLFEGKVSDFQLPVPSCINCRSSSNGWLALIEKELCPSDGTTTTTYPVLLFNPFRSDHENNKIHLPPLPPPPPPSPPRGRINPYDNLSKVIFSSNPTTTDDKEELVVFVLPLMGDIQFCRPGLLGGDQVWTPIPTPNNSYTFDVIFYKGRLWGILENGSALVFDIAPPEPKFTTLVDPYPGDYGAVYPPIRYLVESAGDLFHVRRDHNTPFDFAVYGYKTVGFQVFKLDPATMQWVKTNTLDDRMFFLGDNASMSFSVLDNFPQWCKPNSIYFTDDNYRDHCTTTKSIGPHDIVGVFNLQSRSFEPLYTMDSKPIIPVPPIMPPPIWIQPNLYY